MKTMLRSVAATMGVGIVSAFFATQASAGCAELRQPQTAPPAWQPQPSWPLQQSGPTGFIRTAFLQVSDEAPRSASIVGFWKFTFTAKGNGPYGPPDGAPIDAGYVTWHSDGTELTNSSRPPASSSFCMGVWKQTGHATYKLNHYALSWTPDGGTFVGPANIREEITVDRRGNTYTGTFTIDQYDQTETTVLAHIAGTVTGTRITAD